MHRRKIFTGLRKAGNNKVRIEFLCGLLACLVVWLTFFLSGCSQSSPTAPTGSFGPPRLFISGNQIVNSLGVPQILRGVSIADPCFLSEVDKHLDEQDFQVLAQDWKVTIVRVPIYPDLFSSDPNYLSDYVDSVVAWAGKYGIYAFIGWHAHGNPLTGQTENPSWASTPPWHGNPYNPNLNLAVNALRQIAYRYKDKPWVIYGTFNEPAFITWNVWMPIAEQLVDAVHSANPSALVMVSGVDWGYDLSGAISNPVKRPNVVYEIHPYPWKGITWKYILRQVHAHYPVFVGEWGFDTEMSSSYEEENYGKPLVNFCAEEGIGWTAWVWHDTWQPSMLASFNGYSPTPYGTFVKQSLSVPVYQLLNASRSYGISSVTK